MLRQNLDEQQVEANKIFEDDLDQGLLKDSRAFLIRELNKDQNNFFSRQEGLSERLKHLRNSSSLGNLCKAQFQALEPGVVF